MEFLPQALTPTPMARPSSSEGRQPNLSGTLALTYRNRKTRWIVLLQQPNFRSLAGATDIPKDGQANAIRWWSDRMKLNDHLNEILD